MFLKIKHFLIGSYEEFHKVIWPSRKEVVSHTVIVIVSILISMGLIASIDYGLFSLVQQLILNRGA